MSCDPEPLPATPCLLSHEYDRLVPTPSWEAVLQAPGESRPHDLPLAAEPGILSDSEQDPVTEYRYRLTRAHALQALSLCGRFR